MRLHNFPLEPSERPFWETQALVICQEYFCLTIKALDLTLLGSNLGHIYFSKVT